MIVSFTGHAAVTHREEALVAPMLEQAISGLWWGSDPRELRGVVGGAPGVDTIAAERLHYLRFPYTLALPDTHYKAYWIEGPGADRMGLQDRERWAERFDLVLERAAEVVYVNDSVRPGNNFRRNEWMVDHSDRTIAVKWRKSSGTDHCIRYAKHVAKTREHPLLILDPLDTSTSTR